jgi:ribonuclease R
MAKARVSKRSRSTQTTNGGPAADDAATPPRDAEVDATAPRPLPRRDAILDVLAAHGRPMHTFEIAERLGLPTSRAPWLQGVLDDLSFDGSVAAMPGHKFKLSRGQLERHGAEMTGILGVNPRGFGFVAAAPDKSGKASGESADVYIPAEAMRGAMHGDTVRVRIVTRSHRGVEGEVVDVVARRSPRIPGTLRKRGRSLWLEPDDQRIRGPIVLAAPIEGGADGDDGEAAVATITRYPLFPGENPEGRLDAVLGAVGDPEVEIEKILLREGVDEAHPHAAVIEAEAFGREVDPGALEGREDLTTIPLPTIDPEDARDHDDAVWVTRDDEGNYKAWIAIADVSHYVRPGTELDASALARGCSIYLPDRAIPMLPRALSSNLCSLLPGVVRLCLALEVDLDATGEITRYRLVEGFMRSIAKLTYPGVARALGFSTEPAESPEAEALKGGLEVAWDLAKILRGKRMRRGALDFELPEAKVVLDPATKAPIDVVKRAQDPGVTKAYHLVEELMLLANETVARFTVDRGAPTIFRDHGAPDPAKLERFATMCQELGVEFDLEEATDPKKLSAFLKKIQAHPKREVLHMLLLRAMRQAAYDVANIGHFGLASTAYLHFTSPIRRYPDLVVHRGVRALLRGDKARGTGAEEIERLRTGAMMASENERKAMTIEREVVDLDRALVMKSKLGAELSGTVSGLVGSGVFVQIAAPFVDVLVKSDALGGDDYELDDEQLRFVGRRSGDRIGLGDAMVVRVEEVSILRRTVYGRRLGGRVEGTRESRRGKERQTDARNGKRGRAAEPAHGKHGKPTKKGGGRRKR